MHMGVHKDKCKDDQTIPACHDKQPVHRIPVVILVKEEDFYRLVISTEMPTVADRYVLSPFQPDIKTQV